MAGTPLSDRGTVVNILRPMPSSDEPAAEAHRTIAPLVGPDDERVFTDSGIEIERLYTE